MTLFDSVDEPGGRAPASPFGSEPRRVSLVRLSALIAQAAGSVGRLSVEGEVHRPQTGRTGRQWFTLRDRAAQITVSVPNARRSRCRVVAGERVSVTGRLEWVNDWGQLQLLAEEVLPVGEGAIAAMIAEARRSLERDGLLARPRRRVPQLPAVIGVICGHEAAVRADIESVVTSRFPGYPVSFWETTVSGPGAVDNIVAAINELDARPEIEVIILARGGGDATALLPFSDEALCRAVCATATPVVAAIGHDGDRPLVDEVADLRCGTPSLAAGAVVPDGAALRARLDQLVQSALGQAANRAATAVTRLAAVDRRRAVASAIDRAVARLDRAGAQRHLVHPARELDRACARLDRADWAARSATRLARSEQSLEAVWAQVEALSPARVLERGYAVVRRTADGVVVRDPAQVLPGQQLEVTVAAGRFGAQVADAAGTGARVAGTGAQVADAGGEGGRLA